MKEKMHPTYHDQVTVHCACGETFVTRSTRKEIRVEICSKCHPFFTGKQKLIDSAGRVERFNTRYKDVSSEPKPVKKVVKAGKKGKSERAPVSPEAEA